MSKHHHHKPHHKRHGASALTAFVDVEQLSRSLTPWLPDTDERDFVLRCVLEEGPAHHRGANYVLLSLLVRLAGQLGVTAPAPGAARAFEMRLPPHLEDEIDEREWPIGVPEAPLLALAADGRAVDAMVDCVTDGPPQHAVANVLMLQLLNALLSRTARP